MAGPIVPVAAPVLVDLAALSSFDFVLIDGEHGHVGYEAAEHLTRAAEAGGITPLARVAHNAPHEILRMLDLGVQGVMVPQVSTAEGAEAAVRAAKYAPRGSRGMGGGRPADYGLGGSMAEYAERANAETMVIALIEDIKAVEALDSILAVDGIDVFFIGPSDLAQSMGHTGRADHPEVRAVIEQTIERIVARNRVAGINAPSTDAVRAYRERGVRFFCVGPWHHLAAAWREYVASVRA